MSAGRIHQVNVSPGGVPKRAVQGPVRVTALGLEGDSQRMKKIHGGPMRAVSLYALECLEQLRAEGHAAEPGALGENLTLAGLRWSEMTPGLRLQLGDAVILELTKYVAPCRTIRHVFADGDFSRIAQEKHPGESRLYARVLVEGAVRAGDVATVLR